MSNREKYVDMIYENLKKFPTIEKYLKKSIDIWVMRGLPHYLEQPLIRSIYSNEGRNCIAAKFEEFLKFIIEKKGSKNIHSKISRLNEDPEANFDEFYSELSAGYYLLKECKAKGIEFSTKGESYDISYFAEYNKKKYYVEVKSLMSLDPYPDIFLNKISAKAICDSRYNRCYEISYDYPEGQRVGMISKDSEKEVSKVIKDLDYEFQKGDSFGLQIIDDNGYRKYRYLRELNFTAQTNYEVKVIAWGRTAGHSTVMRNLIRRVGDHCKNAYSQLNKVRKGNIESNDTIVICLNWDEHKLYGDNFNEELNNQIKLLRSELFRNIRVKLL